MLPCLRQQLKTMRKGLRTKSRHINDYPKWHQCSVKYQRPNQLRWHQRSCLRLHAKFIRHHKQSLHSYYHNFHRLDPHRYHLRQHIRIQELVPFMLDDPRGHHGSCRRSNVHLVHHDSIRCLRAQWELCGDCLWSRGLHSLGMDDLRHATHTPHGDDINCCGVCIVSDYALDYVPLCDLCAGLFCMCWRWWESGRWSI